LENKKLQRNPTTGYVNVSSPEFRANHYINTDTRSFQNVAKYRYLGMTSTNVICIPEETETAVEIFVLFATFQIRIILPSPPLFKM
jgi:hypothetical protein